MDSNWLGFLVERGARKAGAGAHIVDFGQPTEELGAAAAGGIVAPLTQYGLIACDGEDAKSFLHNQFTSDVNHLGEASAQHAAWCTAKGRMIATFVVWRQDEGYRLLVSGDLLDPVLKRLQMFVLRSKVRLADHGDRCVLLGLAGSAAATALDAAGLPAPETVLATAEADGAKVVRLDDSRFVVACPVERAIPTWDRLSAELRPAGLAAWRWLDIVKALPVVTAATREEFVPQMADFERIGGVSFHKGCYPGQEVVARTQYLGKVKRHLYRAAGKAPVAAGNELFSPDNPDQAIGRIVSAAEAPEGGYVALAVVQSNYATDVRVGSRDGAAIAVTPVNPCA